MKQKLQVWMGVMALAGALAATAAAQSLGDLARQERAKKGAAPAAVKEYTNDNLPTSGGISEAGAAPASASSAAASRSEATPEEKKEDRGKQETEWRAKFKAQKDKIATLEREVAVRTNENQSQNVRYLMSFPQAAEQAQKNQDEIKEKQKELAAAKQRLEDMTEELRKAGLPSSWAD